jgi:hypothetical protein
MTETVVSDSPDGIEVPVSRCEACIECDDHREDITAGAPSWEQIPELQAPSELVAYPGLQTTLERHIADPDGILASYHFDEEVACSLKGSHRHQQGIVVKTLCQMVLCMGLQCGKKSVVGFDGIIRDTRRRARYHANLAALRDWLPNAKKRLHESVKRLRVAEDAQATLKQQLPSLFAELKWRQSRGPSSLEVHIQQAKPKFVPEELEDSPTPTFRLKGLCIIQGKQAAVTQLQSTLTAYEEQERKAPPIDGPSAADLRKIALRFDERLGRLNDWLTDAASFATEDNLALCLIALGRDNSNVSREGMRFRVSYMPDESALIVAGSAWSSA